MNRDFVFLIPSDIFYDPDGYMTKIVFLNKPTWLNILNGQVLQGKTPPDTGVYKINIRGYDNRGAFAEAQYVINVVAPSISFKIIEATYFEDYNKIKTSANLKNNLRIDNFDSEKLYNIVASCNIDSVKMKLNLSGAYFFNRTSDYFPHSLMQDGSGFNPPIGDYLIYAEAYYKDKLVAKNQVNFSYFSSAKTADEWQVFPNPCTGVLNIKLPKNLKPEEADYQIVTETGQVFSRTFKNIKSDSKLESIDLVDFPAGKYFLKINTIEKSKSIPFLRL
jgi:Secretion system C-terminal sorting domain